MKPYADDAPRRARQITADVVAIVAIALFVWLAVTVRTIIGAFGELGIRLQEAGDGFSDTMREIGDTLGGVPIIGSGIAAPFDGASQAGDTLADAGDAVRGTVEAISILAAFAVAALPIAAILVLWLVPRVRFARRAGELQRMVRSGVPLDLIALRGLVTLPLAQVLAQHPDPAEAWRRGDPELVQRLAALELRRDGVALR